ncbi:MAG: thioredoxin domain-containing protein [Pyrinomonadaceae bacterium]
MSKQQQTKQSGAPVIIIVLVALVAGFLGFWYYNSSKGSTGSANRTASNGNSSRPAANSSAIPPDAPAGAQPPNLLGSPTASVTIEEFADFQCPSCAQVNPIMKQLQSIYGSRIRFVFRNFPLPGHDKAYDAAVAAEAAGLQGPDKFWAMQNQLYTNQRDWSSDPNFKQAFRTYAEKIGLDVDRWTTDIAGLQAKGRVDADLQRARAIGVSSTPTVYINGKMVPYPDLNLTTLRQLVDAELAASAPQTGQPSSPANGNSAPKR